MPLLQHYKLPPDNLLTKHAETVAALAVRAKTGNALAGTQDTSAPQKPTEPASANPHRIIAIGRPAEERQMVDSAREAYDAWKTSALPRFGFLNPDGSRREQDKAAFPDFDRVLKEQFPPAKLQEVLRKLQEGVLIGNLGLMVHPEFTTLQATFSAMVAAMNADQVRRGQPQVYVDSVYGQIDSEALSKPIVAFRFSLAEADLRMEVRSGDDLSKSRGKRMEVFDNFAEKHGLKGDDRVSAAVSQLFGLHNDAPMTPYPSYDMLPADPLRKESPSQVPGVRFHDGRPDFLWYDADGSVGHARLRSRVGDDVPFA